MASFELSLSNKVQEDGKQQVLVRISIGRNVRFRIKSGISVNAEYWNAEKQSIAVPIKRKNNIAKVRDAEEQQTSLTLFVTELGQVISASKCDTSEQAQEWIEDAFRVKPILLEPSYKFARTSTGQIFTYDNIVRALALENEAKEKAKKATLQNDGTSSNLYDLAHLYCKRNGISESRAKSYHNLARQIARFEYFTQLTERKDFKMQADTLTTEDAEAFRDYIAREAKLQKDYPAVFAKVLAKYPICTNDKKRRTISDRGDNYIIGQMKRLKAIMNWCYATERTSNKPLDRVNIGKESYGTPIYITREERDTIADFDLSEQSDSIRTQRDIFIFQCHTGCRVGDLYSLTQANIVDDTLEYTPSKTEDTTEARAIVPLTERAKRLIEQYKGKDTKGRLFPFIAEQNYNEAIKTVFRLCRITRNVEVRNATTGEKEVRSIADIASSHLARRTFVGAAYAQVQDPALIGKMSGHAEGSKAFSRYRNVSKEMLKNVISKIE